MIQFSTLETFCPLGVTSRLGCRWLRTIITDIKMIIVRFIAPLSGIPTRGTGSKRSTRGKHAGKHGNRKLAARVGTRQLL